MNMTPGWWNKAPVQTRIGRHPKTKGSIGLNLDWQTLVKVVRKLYSQHFIFLDGSNKLSCKIFEHFALQVDRVIEFIQLRSTAFKVLAPKLADPPF